jgi:hypothetical protein
VIYGLAFLLFIDFESAPSSTFESFLFLFSWKRLKFSLISLGSFLGLTSFFYALYGYTFLFETYFYHFIRSDHRHNFSPQFYPMYLKMSSNSTSEGAEGGRQESVLEFFTILFGSLSIPVTPGLSGGGSAAAAHLGELGAYLEVVNKYTIGLSAWMPQLALILILTIVFYRDLPFCAFLITLVFVSFNKVITVQVGTFSLSSLLSSSSLPLTLIPLSLSYIIPPS